MALPPLLALLRPHQWIKNAFVAAPLFFTPAAWNAASLLQIVLGVVSFCMLASAVYVLNDYLDREADRAHPSKRTRPLAAGTVSVPLALATGGLLVALGLGLAFWLTPAFGVFALVYLANNIAYSLYLKHQAILDVMSIAFGFVLRVEGGGALIDVTLSAWIVIITGLLALFLAIAKRRDDIVKKLGSDHRKALDGYSRRFLDASLSLVLGSLLVAYLIYTTDTLVMERLGTDRLYYTAPFVAFGILRYLQITMVEERSGSPTLIVLKDRPIILCVLGWILTFGWLIYD